MTDLFWDEVLLTNNPDSKELEVSFKKIDGDGFITSAGEEPGTPGGTIEGSDGSQPPTDDEGDFEPGNEGDQTGGEGSPVGPSEPPEECGTTKCDNYDNYTNSDADLSSSPHLIYDSLTTLDRSVILPGTSTFNVNNPATPENAINTSQILSAPSSAFGPCTQPPGPVYGVVPWTGGNLGVSRCILEDYKDSTIIIGQGQNFTLTGGFGCYIMDRDQQGNVKTTGTEVISPLYVKPIMESTGSSNFYTGSLDILISIRNQKTGSGGNGTNTIIGSGLDNDGTGLAGTNDLSGTFSCTWEVTYALSSDGTPSIAATVKASHAGAQIVATKVGSPIVTKFGEMAIDLNKQAYIYYAGDLPVLSHSAYGGSGAGGEASINEWKKAYERSLQNYVPPDYCQRIP